MGGGGVQLSFWEGRGGQGGDMEISNYNNK